MGYCDQKIKDLYLNLRESARGDLFYITENRDWAIKQVGLDLQSSLSKQGLIPMQIRTTTYGLKNKIIHFGSPGTLPALSKIKKLARVNRIIITCFHFDPQNTKARSLARLAKHVSFFHTSCNLTRDRLLHLGITATKIIVIPLGIDLKLFQNPKEQSRIRETLNLPPNHFIIGSFQKDGTGWGKGLKPKLIKGPDLFVQAVTRLKKYRPFVLLTGPSRGYVKNQLAQNNIPYLHLYPRDYTQIPTLYRALDLYLITSRLEGGPKSILEAWISKIPVVSTNVGMVKDIARNNHNILLTENFNPVQIAKQVERIILDQALKLKIIKYSNLEVKKYDWSQIASIYYQKLYQPCLTSLKLKKSL